MPRRSAAGGGAEEKSIQIFSAHPYGSPDLSRLKQLAHRLLDAEGWCFDFDIIVADDHELRRLNRLFLGRGETTDVMAFPAGEDQSDRGEVYVNLDQARVQALEAGEPVQQSLERLLIHGILHLGGWRDDTDAERERMLRYGERYLSPEVTGGSRSAPSLKRGKKRSTK